MLILFFGVLALIAFGSIAFGFAIRYRQLSLPGPLDIPSDRDLSVSPAIRYRPMLRLLSEADIALVSADKQVAAQLRNDRNRIFRRYLRCLTRDYARLLHGIRLAMVHSTLDRPDLARALTVNKFRFAVALCQIEFRLRLHSAGIGKVDVSGLVEAVDVLGTQVSYLTPASLSLR